MLQTQPPTSIPTQTIPLPNIMAFTGKVEKIIFRNDETGWTVMLVRIGNKSQTITGTVPFTLIPDQNVSIEGEPVYSQKYGNQIKGNKIEVNDPTTKEGIAAYLESGIISGIGPKMAAKIMSHFGEAALTILDESPERLKEVKGIREKTLARIMGSWKEKRESSKIMGELYYMGISMAYAMKVYKEYGENAVHAVKENPYRLADEVTGIGFITADNIAQKLGFDKTHTFRIQAGVLYILQNAQSEGHSYLPQNVLIEKAKKMIAVEEDAIYTAISTLKKNEKLIQIYLPTIHDNVPVYYIPYNYNAEKYIEYRLKQTAVTTKSPCKKILEYDNLLTEEQKIAVQVALNNNLSVITGAAGTGKTTTLKALIKCLEDNNLSYLLCAPTGRAAKRLNEVTGREATTIHRMIGLNPHSGIKSNEVFTLNVDYVIIDEASMIDLPLMANIMKALPLEGSLVLIGDPNQLPPVGVGKAFSDIIEAGMCPISRLTVIKRQQTASNVINVANDINTGNLPTITNTEDCYMFQIEDTEKIAQRIVDLVTHKIGQKFGIPFNDIMVLSPMKKGPIGTEALNKLIQDKVRDPHAVDIKGFKVGDRVMQTQNNYDKNVFNGDVGYIREIDLEENRLTVKFEGIAVEIDYEKTEINELMLCYASTVHRFQGSEVPCIVIPIHMAHYIMLRRDLLYTAVTRTKNKLILVGTKKALMIGVKNNIEQRRYTGLLKDKRN